MTLNTKTCTIQHCLNEVLRLYPVVPYNTRMALKDTTLPRGGGKDGNQPIGVLKDTRIAYLTLTMQRRADLMPPPSSTFAPVDTFSPERWDSWYPKSWNYIPFNGGPRICVGQQFALTEMGYTVVRILQKFEKIEDRMPPNTEGNKPWGDGPCMKAEIVLQPGEGVKVGFYEAK
jgi:cytochrome P450